MFLWSCVKQDIKQFRYRTLYFNCYLDRILLLSNSIGPKARAILNGIERPADREVYLGKILCPNDHCVDNNYFSSKTVLFIILAGDFPPGADLGFFER